jgi:hypothetical protein
MHNILQDKCENQTKITDVKSLEQIWLELGHGNITFSEELDFDPEELDIVYADNDTEASQ